MYASHFGFMARMMVLVLAISVAVLAFDYCKDSKCKMRHIGCNPPTDFSADCPPGATIVTMNKDLVVKRHNLYRSAYAQGDHQSRKQFPAAVRMAQMQWNDELAQLALYNARRCKYDHDICRDTAAFPYAGQSIGRYVGNMQIYHPYKDNITEDEMILRRIKVWQKESLMMSYDELNAYPFIMKPSCGDALLLLRESNTHVGCAGVRFPRNGFDLFYITCNYATSNFMMQRTFEFGSVASKCTKLSPHYQFLCSIDEEYDQFKFPFQPPIYLRNYTKVAHKYFTKLNWR